jgi:hypothetical protein
MPVEGSFTLTPPAPYGVSAWLVFGATLVATAAVILVLERRKRE